MKDLRNLKITISFYMSIMMFFLDAYIVPSWENLIKLGVRMIFSYLLLSLGMNIAKIYQP